MDGKLVASEFFFSLKLLIGNPAGRKIKKGIAQHCSDQDQQIIMTSNMTQFMYKNGFAFLLIQMLEHPYGEENRWPKDSVSQREWTIVGTEANARGATKRS